MHDRVLDGNLIEAFFTQVPRAMWIIRRALRKEASPDLSVPQFRILAHLKRGPKANNELAEVQGVSISTMTRLVDPLVERGLVTRSMDPEDRRRVQLALTDSGRKLFQLIRKKASGELVSLFSLLDRKEKKALFEGLRVLERLEGLAGEDA